MRFIVAGTLIIVGFTHVLPLTGAFGTERLTALYGLPIHDPNLVILMRHRAVLFGLMGLFFILAAFKASYRTAAFVGGFVSVLSFLFLAWSVGSYNAQLGRVFTVDLVALVCLVLGCAAHLYQKKEISRR